MRRFISLLGARLQGAIAVCLLIAVVAWAGATNYDRLVLGNANEGTDPGLTNSLDIVLENDESIDGQTASTITFGRDDAGTVTLTARDTDATAALTIKPGGAAAMTIGGASTTSVDITTDGGTVTIDGVGITPGGVTADPAAGNWTFTKTSAGGAVLIGADDAGAADTTLDTTGAGAITIGSADVTGITLTHDGGSLSTATASTLTLTALTTADATFIGADAAGAANTTLDTTGAGAITIGSADVTAVTITTDATGDGTDVVLPTGAISTGEVLDGTILAADIGTAGVDVIQICGDATTVNNNTVYYGPSQVVSATTASGAACDTSAAGNVTEATADAPPYAAQAFQVRGMTCRTVDLGATTTFTLRSAAAATTPSVVASIADNILDGVADVQTTTAIASGATLAVAVASAGDLPTSAFVCNIYVTY